MLLMIVMLVLLPVLIVLLVMLLVALLWRFCYTGAGGAASVGADVVLLAVAAAHLSLRPKN